MNDDIKILYVEDETPIRKLYTPFIKEKASELYVAENGLEGLKLYKKHKPDLIISDIRMPKMDGLEMINNIKSLQSEVRIIIVTAFSQPQYFTRAIKLGVNGFLVKPVTKDDILAVVDEQINTIRLQKKIKIEEEKRGIAERDRKKGANILRAVSFAGEEFLLKTRLEEIIPKVLKNLGKATSVSRVYLFQNETRSRKIYTSQIFEWVAEGIKSKISDYDLQDIPLKTSGFKRWISVLSKHKPLYGLVREFPKSEQQKLMQQNILSMVIVPIFVQDYWWGFLGFDDCLEEREWAEQEISTLATAANLIGTAIHRNNIESQLKKLNNDLENRINVRTLELQKEITERIQAEEMLRESEEKYRQIFENANDGIMLTIDGIVKFINPKLYEITGFLPKESISKPFTQFVHPDYQEVVYQNHLGRLKGEEVTERYDIQAYTKSGEPKWFELKSALIQWENQDAVLTFITDITERKKNAAELRELNLRLENRVKEELKKTEEQQQLLIQKSKLESLGKLAAGIAHEINQPLGAISLLLDNIQYKSDKGDLDKEYLDKKLKKSFEDIDRIRMIIDHIRAFSRDQDKAEFVKVDVNMVIHDALSMIKHQYIKQNISFELKLDLKKAFIFGNPYKLEQVLLNLFSNANYALNEKEKLDNNIKKVIQITAYQKVKNICIEIEDNGTGISKTHQENIFDPFYTTKSADEGTGLGLSISYGIIKEMNGDIKVESKENKYTKMIIALPMLNNKT